ncbi:Hachiman antiphage defense system protein HamA [Mesorhizobium sp. SP-1A]|uniref:Hachiman antiphage defense system protein HamA n=2 Tax=Pseudomonadota TaxID=1224 RepID=UPI0028F7292D|nr:Hachiman antiphage defense system protein HamA [Mesorhizobium sp. SP-1A]
MPLYDNWCDSVRANNGQKLSLRLTEKPTGRAAAMQALPPIVRSHYDDVARINEDIAALGFTQAAAILAERLPRTPRARSGELGEILATELVEEQLGYRVPVRRLRYKDGREMALRGDDFLGLRTDPAGAVHVAKGESKSRANLTAATIAEARDVLSRDAGRPTPTSILFVTDRLLERGGDEEALGRALRNDVATKIIPAAQIAHILFTVSANNPPQALDDDLENAGVDRPNAVIHLKIEDHQDFIRLSYEEALKLGND